MFLWQGRLAMEAEKPATYAASSARFPFFIKILFLLWRFLESVATSK